MNSPPWRPLFRHADHMKVEAVWLAIRSMEYPARLCDAAGPLPEQEDDSHNPTSKASSSDRLPTCVEVHADHFDELTEVLDEIVGEQDELDEVIARRDAIRQRRQRQFRVFVAAAVVGVLAVLLVSQLFR